MHNVKVRTFDDLPKKKTDAFSQRNLDGMSVDELQTYILMLQDEIERVEGDMASKKKHSDDADQFFKS